MPLTKHLKDLTKKLAQLADHSDSKIRKQTFDCLQRVFESVEEDAEIMIKHFFKGTREFILNEIKAVFKKVHKKKHLIRLFENEHNSSKNYLPSIDQTKVHDASIQHRLRPQAVELSAILPTKLLEMNYLSNNSEKKPILDDFLKKLEGIQEIKASQTSSQASNLIKILRECLEEANLLIVTVALQIIIRLFQLMKGCFNEIVTKQIIMYASYKVKFWLISFNLRLRRTPLMI
jgi:hypothetical protein